MHQWSVTPLENQTADARAQFPEGQPIPSLNNGVRGAMATAARWRDDNLGAALKATLGPNNVYSVSTAQGLIDPKTVGNGLTANISRPYSLKVTFDTDLSGSVAAPPMLAVDGAPAVPLLRNDGSALKDGDLVAPGAGSTAGGRVFEILGDFATPGTDTAVTRARVLSTVRSAVADFARAAGIGRRNRVIDPGFQVSQINGSNAVALVSGTPAYPSDSVYADFQGAVGGATVQRFAGQTVSGAEFYHRLTVAAANANPGAADRLRLVIPFEGAAIADLLLGTAGAKAMCVSFDARMPAGTYAVAVRNGVAATRSWLGSFTIAAGQNQIWTPIDIPVPGDVAGVWAADNTRGLEISIAVLVGGGRQSGAGWQGGDYLGPALTSTNGPMTNGMAAAGSTFDVGAPRFTEGSAPQDFELPDPTLELHKCRRYLRKATRYSVLTDQSTNTAVAEIILDEPMRAQPSITAPAPQSIIIPGQNYFTQTQAGIANVDFTGEWSTGAILTLGNFVGLPPGVGGFSYPNAGQYLLLDARL